MYPIGENEEKVTVIPSSKISWTELDTGGNTPVLLLAGKHEGQKRGFNLQKWYESFGFKVIKETESGPVMMLDSD
jgi:hypothetical protein